MILKWIRQISLYENKTEQTLEKFYHQHEFEQYAKNNINIYLIIFLPHQRKLKIKKN